MRKSISLILLASSVSLFAANAPVHVRNWSPAKIGANVASANSVFVSVTPCRVMDTRLPNGTYGSPSIVATAVRTLDIANSGCGVPVANSYSLNLTVTGSPAGTQFQFLTLYPAGTTRPNTSSINFPDGGQVANAAIVPAVAGAVDIYSSADTDLIVDINGYYIDAPAAGTGTVTSVGAATGLTATGTATDPVLGIAAGGVGTTELADNSVTTAKIADGNVTTAKIADANVTLAKINTTGATTGQVLSFNGTAAIWTAPVTAVNNSTVLTVSAGNLCSAGAGTNNAASISVGGLNGNQPGAVLVVTPNGGNNTFPTNMPAVAVAFVPSGSVATNCPGNKWVIYTLDNSQLPIGAKYSVFGIR